MYLNEMLKVYEENGKEYLFQRANHQWKGTEVIYFFAWVQLHKVLSNLPDKHTCYKETQLFNLLNKEWWGKAPYYYNYLFVNQKGVFNFIIRGPKESYWYADEYERQYFFNSSDREKLSKNDGVNFTHMDNIRTPFISSGHYLHDILIAKKLVSYTTSGYYPELTKDDKYEIRNIIVVLDENYYKEAQDRQIEIVRLDKLEAFIDSLPVVFNQRKVASINKKIKAAQKHCKRLERLEGRAYDNNISDKIYGEMMEYGVEYYGEKEFEQYKYYEPSYGSLEEQYGYDDDAIESSSEYWEEVYDRARKFE